MNLADSLKKIRWAASRRRRIVELIRNEYRAEQGLDWQRKVPEHIEIIRQSELFDGDWYLRNHIELQNRGIDPAEDYLLHGLPWRNPSASFSNLEYWYLHPEVQASGMHPLLHYELHGKQEGAAISVREHPEGDGCDNTVVSRKPVISLAEHRASFPEKAAVIRRKIERGERVEVVFFASNMPMFSLSPLFKCMLQDEMFSPRITIIPDFRKPDYRTEMEQCERELLDSGFPPNLVSQATTDERGNWADVCIGADIACYDLPYYNITNFRYTPYYSVGRSFLPIMANYMYPQSLYARKVLALDEYCYLWKALFECEDTLEEYRSCSQINGENAALVGYVKMDPLDSFESKPKPRKKVLVALHHSIDGGANDELGFANFIRYFDYFCTLPDRYPELDFVYRPHPFLFDALKNAEKWDDEKIDSFTKMMEEKDNFSWCIGGNYLQSFAESDACIQDCGSFLVEYLYTGNPCCYMLKHPSDIERKYSPLGKACLEQYYLSYDTDSIDQFITSVVIGGHDEKAEERKTFSSRIALNYPHSAEAALENIRSSLLGG